jgi:hypothetical protein
MLLSRVGHWSAARWAQDGRNDRVFALVQRLADLAAVAEGRPPRPVPRLADLVLPDQLRVMVADLADAPVDVRAQATAATDETRRTL